MAVLQWSEDFSVNIKEIDDQHKVLISMINELHEALLAKKGREVQKPIIDKMVAYAKDHFALEENYMRKFNYADYEAHHRSHAVFTQKADELQERLEKVGFVFTVEIINFLRDWLRDHILGVDKKYSRLFNENGLS